jgi:hypothetical protein
MSPRADFSQIGMTGLPTWGGVVYDEWLKDLQGSKGRRVIREMCDNDAMIGAVLFSLETLIRQTDWEIKEGKDAAASQFIFEAFYDMDRPWAETLSEILSFFRYGWSLHETLFKVRDGKNSPYNDKKIGWQGWPIRGQETLLKWDFSPYGDILAMRQLGPPDFKEHVIPMEKALLFRTTTQRNSPEGRSLLRNAYRSWYFKKRIEAIEGIGIERDLAGLPVAMVPPELLAENASADDKKMLETIKQIVTNIRRDEQEGVVWPLAYDPDAKLPVFDLKLLSTGGRRQFDTDAIIARYDQRITMTTLADFITLGHERVGSNAMAEAKSRLFTAALRAWLGSICGVINQYAIPRLLRLNGYDVVDPPRLEHGDIERSDIDQLSNAILRIRQAGGEMDLSLHGELMNRVLEILRLPAPGEDAENTIADPGSDTEDAQKNSAPPAAPGTPAIPQPQSPGRRKPRPAR